MQGSVWGSGSAGTLCALAALTAGNAAFWQAGRFVLAFCSGQLSCQLMYVTTVFLKLPPDCACSNVTVQQQQYISSVHCKCSSVCFQVGFVASFVSKFSDTVSSEIGKVGIAHKTLTAQHLTRQADSSRRYINSCCLPERQWCKLFSLLQNLSPRILP